MSNDKSQSKGKSSVSQGNSQDKHLICDSLLGLAYDNGEGELADHTSLKSFFLVDQVKPDVDHADVKENKVMPKQIHEKKLKGIK